jgi:hypothetical protein
MKFPSQEAECLENRRSAFLIEEIRAVWQGAFRIAALAPPKNFVRQSIAMPICGMAYSVLDCRKSE